MPGKMAVEVLEQLRKNIAIVALGGNGIGGAEKRFTNFFMYATDNKLIAGLFLILSREKYNALKKQFPKLTEYQNVIIINPLSEKFSKTLIGKAYLKAKAMAMNYYVLSYLASPFLLLRYSNKLKKIIKQNNIQLIHAFWEGITECAIVRKRNPELKFLMSYVEPVGRFLKNRFFRNNPGYLPFSIKTADALELQCEPYLNVLKKNRVFPAGKKYFIAPCSFTDYSKSKITDKENKVVFLARLDKYKNPLLFLEAAKIVLEKRTDVSFEIWGNGNLKKQIVKYLIAHKLENKAVFGFTDNPTDVFSNSKIFCSLASFGSFPEQSTLEALSCENALITTDVEGSAGFANADFSVKTEFNAKDLASKIEYLIDNPELCNKLAKAGKEFATKYHTIELFSEYLINTYNQVIKE